MMIQVSPWAEMGQGLIHTKMIQVSPWRNRDGARSIHKDDTG